MRGKKYFQAFSILSVLTILCAFAGTSAPPVNIENIHVQSGLLDTKIIIQSASPLSILDSRYLQGNASTLAVNLDNAQALNEPNVRFDKASLVKNIRMESSQDKAFRLLLDVKERVPYRIYTQQDATVIHFNKYQNNQQEYILDPAIENQVNMLDAPSVYLKDIVVSDSDDTVDVIARLTSDSIPNVFVLKNPLRLVVDLHNTLYSNRATNHSLRNCGVEKVRAAQFQVGDPYTITRMVFDLKEPQEYTLDSRGDELVVSFSKTATAPAAPKVTAPESPHPLELETSPPVEEEAAETAVTEANETVENSSLGREVGFPDVKPAKSVNTPPLVTQDQQFEPRTIAAEETKYSGELVSLKFKDADLQAVIFYLAEIAGLNVTFDPGVSGLVSCNYRDVPWDQALDLILKQNKMGSELEGNVLRIAPINVLTKEQDDQRRLEESQELAGPMQTKTFWLSYSKAGDVQGLLRSKLSTRGEIIIDSRTNTLTISDVEDRMMLIESMIEVFDTPTPQVAIEARIIEATSTFIRNLGIQWGWRGIQDPFYGNQTSLKFPNRTLIDGALIPQGIVTKGVGGPLGGYAINLPAPAFTTAAGVSFANVLDTFRLDLALTALETSGSGRIISAPKVTTQNNQEAFITQGRQIPVQTVANFTVTTRYVNAALELRATPQITAEGTIIMNIIIRNNAADFANLVNGIPPITMQSAETTVMVPDGGTTVIGGIYRTEDSITRERVPFFHKIPILGNLFKSFARTKQNRELLIFITPRIIK